MRAFPAVRVGWGAAFLPSIRGSCPHAVRVGWGGVMSAHGASKDHGIVWGGFLDFEGFDLLQSVAEQEGRGEGAWHFL